MYSEILLFHCCWLAIWLRHYYANCCLHFWLFAVHENALEYLKKEKFCLKLLLFLILKRGTLKGEKLKNQKICPSGPPLFFILFFRQSCNGNDNSKLVIGTCLSVSENASIVALKSVVQYIMTKTLEDLFLSRKLNVARIQRIEAMVKSKTFDLLSTEK